MVVYRRRTWVDAPLADVWAFHSTADGLAAITPEWLRLRVEEVRGPDGSPNPDALGVGAQVRTSVRPFGVGPRLPWTTRITWRESGTASAAFEDEMTEGPFRTWRHRHEFYADGDRTLVRDVVAYELPLGRVGVIVGPLAVVGFEPVFAARHRRTRRRLEPPRG